MSANIHPIVEELREHADRMAGGGPSESTYDPETLMLEHRAANEIERLYAAIIKHRDTFADEPLEEERELWSVVEGTPL